jgi:hypothetical protein
MSSITESNNFTNEWPVERFHHLAKETTVFQRMARKIRWKKDVTFSFREIYIIFDGMSGMQCPEPPEGWKAEGAISISEVR